MTPRIAWLLVVTALAGAACARSRTPQFIVTAEPLNVGVVGSKLCIAVDVNAKDGVWWWQPGASGCDSRSTGPVLFRGGAAKVHTWHMSRGHAAEFQLPTHSTASALVQVRLVLRDGRMTAVATSATVPTVVRGDLEIPEKVGRLTRQ